jgi:hypothetical protein
MIDVQDFFRAYVDDRQGQTIASFEREAFPHLVRYTAQPPRDEGFVLFANLDAGRETAQIREQVDYFRKRGQDFEWKVYALDHPRDLRERLAAEGFEPDDEEMLMVYPLATSTRQYVPRIDGVEIKRIVDEAAIDDIVKMQEQVWSREFGWLRTQLSTLLRDEPDTLSIYAAYRDGIAIGSGWTDFPAGSRFPELHGGALRADARGLGIYAALFDIRLDETKRRGYESICVDASPMSRPILEHVGFVPICTTVPMRKRFA